MKISVKPGEVLVEGRADELFIFASTLENAVVHSNWTEHLAARPEEDEVALAIRVTRKPDTGNDVIHIPPMQEPQQPTGENHEKGL